MATTEPNRTEKENLFMPNTNYSCVYIEIEEGLTWLRPNGKWQGQSRTELYKIYIFVQEKAIGLATVCFPSDHNNLPNPEEPDGCDGAVNLTV
ncbi:hypothetical protein M5K25_013278 [Dendrobium thyrsiflorum]|uniref:Uncharacterized protein n=1 Tax=Dendrobium thyrsiflorum TaxID=117978 RepID=A0ABD0UT98_DENTH